MMNKPQIRFKGFDDEWTLTTMSEGLKFQAGAPFESEFFNENSVGLILIRNRDLKSDSHSTFYSGNFSENFLVSNGDLLVGMDGDFTPCLWNGGKALLNQRVGRILPTNGWNIPFLNYLLIKPLKKAESKTGATTVVHLSHSDVENFMVPITDNVQEQQVIGTYFRQLDEMIAELEREVGRLEKMKQASLQKMFPRPGATTPEIRFKGFNGEWEKVTFSDIFSPIKNNTLSRACLNYDYGKIKNIHYGDILIKFGSIVDVNDCLVPYVNDETGLELNSFNKLSNGDIIFADTAEDEAVGKCVEIDGADKLNVVSGLHTIAVRPNKEFAKGFLGYFLNSNYYQFQLLPLMQGIKVLSISRSAIADTVILYPESLVEQKAIGQYFRNLDELISAKRQKLAKLRNIKHECLDKMFVNTTDNV